MYIDLDFFVFSSNWFGVLDLFEEYVHAPVESTSWGSHQSMKNSEKWHQSEGFFTKVLLLLCGFVYIFFYSSFLVDIFWDVCLKTAWRRGLQGDDCEISNF